jgi:hypothetical protein
MAAVKAAAPKVANRPAAPPVAAASKAAAAGEVYGAQGWQEELSAAELDADAPELDELEDELDGPELGGEDDSEW